MINFLQFIGVGVILAIIFDFFRAYRRYKKVQKGKSVIQNILYFVIAWFIIIFSLLKLINGDIRIYLFFGILIGVLIYLSTFSNYVIKMFIKLFKINSEFMDYILLPIKLFRQILQKIYTFFILFIKKCCKLFLYVIFNIYKFFKNIFSKKVKMKIFNKQKRIKDGKKTKVKKPKRTKDSKKV